jgi:hypothetical protein
MPFFARTPEGPTKIYEHADSKASDPSKKVTGPSTAQSRDEDTRTSKMPDRSARDVQPILIEPNKSVVDVITVGRTEPKGNVTPTQVEKRREYPLIAALEAMLRKQHDEALQHLRAYDHETQEFIIRLAPVLVMVVQTPIKELTAPEIAVINEQLLNALIQFRARSELTVSKMCFCKKVYGFGAYDPLADNHTFVAGTKDRVGDEVQLYVELRNFNSEKTKDGAYLTKLTCTLELHDAAGKNVWSRTLDRIETARRARLNDFYRNYIFYVPAIPAGTYQLTLQITDETNPEQRRVARESVVFRVTPVAN